MRRSLMTLGFLLVVAGCRQSGPVVNPFMGSTTVPPPPTGQAVPAQSAPYYQGAPGGSGQPGTMQPIPGGRVPPASIPPSNNSGGSGTRNSMPPATPYGSQSRTQSPAAADMLASSVHRDSELVTASAVDIDGFVNASASEPPIRIPADPPANVVARAEQAGNLSPRPAPAVLPPAVERDARPVYHPRLSSAAEAALSSELTASRIVHTSGRAVEITDLPAAGTLHGRSGGGVRTASYEQPIAEDVQRIAVEPQARYGHDVGYRVLQGKLQYAHSSGDWKLRYIPIDGQTDDYGGSVQIVNPELLDEFQPGDYVRVQGRIVATGADHGSFAPRYTIASIEPLAD